MTFMFACLALNRANVGRDLKVAMAQVETYSALTEPRHSLQSESSSKRASKTAPPPSSLSFCAIASSKAPGVLTKHYFRWSTILLRATYGETLQSLGRPFDLRSMLKGVLLLAGLYPIALNPQHRLSLPAVASIF
jgi:hypothetical protein